MEFCDPSIEHISSAFAVFECNLALTTDYCLTFTPFPGYTGVNQIFIVGCNDVGICDTVNVTMTVGDCTPNVVLGCTDPFACNYNAAATANDGSCVFIAPGACDCAGNVLDACGDCGGNGVAGCTNPLASNYNAAATCDNGSCNLSVLCLLYTSPSPRDATLSRMPSSA